MSLRLRTPRSIVWLTLLGFLWSTGLPMYESHALAADDAACITIPGAKGETPTMAALETRDQPTHCAVCHLLRAVNGSITPGVVALAVPATQISDIRLALDLIIAADYSVRSSRAPPQVV